MAPPRKTGGASVSQPSPRIGATASPTKPANPGSLATAAYRASAKSTGRVSSSARTTNSVENGGTGRSQAKRSSAPTMVSGTGKPTAPVSSATDNARAKSAPSATAAASKTGVTTRPREGKTTSKAGKQNGDPLPASKPPAASSGVNTKNPAHEKITKEKAAIIEKETRGQRTNPLWYEMRENRITASVAHKIANSRYANDETSEIPQSYLKEVIGSGSSVKTPAMTWGIHNEKKAVEKYAQIKSKATGQDIEVVDCGLFIHPEKNWLAASPDGIVVNKGSGETKELVEIKCPYKHRERTVKEACQDKNFCLQAKGESYALKKGHPYYTQLQCQMAATGLHKADFVVHTNKETAVVPIDFDKKYWDQTLPKLEKFYTEAVIPHLEDRNPVFAKEE